MTNSVIFRFVPSQINLYRGCIKLNGEWSDKIAIFPLGLITSFWCRGRGHKDVFLYVVATDTGNVGLVFTPSDPNTTDYFVFIKIAGVPVVASDFQPVVDRLVGTIQDETHSNLSSTCIETLATRLGLALKTLG